MDERNETTDNNEDVGDVDNTDKNNESNEENNQCDIENNRDIEASKIDMEKMNNYLQLTGLGKAILYGTFMVPWYPKRIDFWFLSW